MIKISDVASVSPSFAGVLQGHQNRQNEKQEARDELLKESENLEKSGALGPAFWKYIKYMDYVEKNFNPGVEEKNAMSTKLGELRAAREEKLDELKRDFSSEDGRLRLAYGDDSREVKSNQLDYLLKLDNLLGPGDRYTNKVQASFGDSSFSIFRKYPHLRRS